MFSTPVPQGQGAIGADVGCDCSSAMGGTSRGGHCTAAYAGIERVDLVLCRLPPVMSGSTNGGGQRKAFEGEVEVLSPCRAAVFRCVPAPINAVARDAGDEPLMKVRVLPKHFPLVPGDAHVPDHRGGDDPLRCSSAIYSDEVGGVAMSLTFLNHGC